MEKQETFTTENFDKLKTICQKIIALSDENIDGSLMFSQLQFLADNIKDLAENPIVKNSGIIKLINQHDEDALECMREKFRTCSYCGGQDGHHEFGCTH